MIVPLYDKVIEPDSTQFKLIARVFDPDNVPVKFDAPPNPRIRIEWHALATLTATFIAPLAASKYASSADVGNEAPGEPPDVVDHVPIEFQLPAATAYLSAIISAFDRLFSAYPNNAFVTRQPVRVRRKPANHAFAVQRNVHSALKRR